MKTVKLSRHQPHGVAIAVDGLTAADVDGAMRQVDAMIKAAGASARQQALAVPVQIVTRAVQTGDTWRVTAEISVVSFKDARVKDLGVAMKTAVEDASRAAGTEPQQGSPDVRYRPKPNRPPKKPKPTKP